MICERCGNELAAGTTFCPICGTRTETARDQAKLPPSTTMYGQDGLKGFGEALSYERGYAPQPYPPIPQQIPMQAPIPPMPPGSGYGFPYPPTPPYPTNIQVNVTMIPTPPNKDGALAAEIILSLFGLFGVGWLLAGEKTVGIILLVCSIFIYWPIVVGGTIVSDGIGLICLGPMAIAAIIINALLLNRYCTRKAQYVMLHQNLPVQQIPYQQPPRQHYPQQ